MTTSPLTERPARQRPGARSGWRLAVGLILLSAIPLTAGVLRLVQLAGGPELFPADPRFNVFPVALLVHIVGSAVFAFVGALQFVRRFRRRPSSWHRRAGRVLVVAGLLVVASALWLTLFYDPQPGSGRILFFFRLVVAPAMATCLVLGFTAIRRRDIVAHRAWMIRAYALGLGAGTQIFTEGFGQAIFGEHVVAGDLEKAAAWILNLAVAEWAIRRGATQRPRRTAAAVRERVPA
jgi:cytochrome bd-type quinol oxidase subunit 2